MARLVWQEVCLDFGNPNYGTTHFDHVAGAWLCVFQIITLEGWVFIMYDVMDGFSGWACMYFVTLIFIGSFFLLNLTLGVISEIYDDIQVLLRAQNRA